MQSPGQIVKSHLEKKSSNEQGNAHYGPRPAKVTVISIKEGTIDIWGVAPVFTIQEQTRDKTSRLLFF